MTLCQLWCCLTKLYEQQNSCFGKVSDFTRAKGHSWETQQRDSLGRVQRECGDVSEDGIGLVV